MSKKSPTDSYCTGWTTWQRIVPPLVVGESPVILIEFLRLADVENGICRSELQRLLVLNQPRVSKLSDKLIQLEWLEVAANPRTDARLEFLKTTTKARRFLAQLDRALSERNAPSAPRRRSAIVLLRDQNEIDPAWRSILGYEI
jgi:DNA-binding MarR family transcriptional regulator